MTMLTQVKRCPYCNEEFNEEDIRGSLIGAFWEALGPYGDEELEEDGQPKPPAGALFDPIWIPKCGWHHADCRYASGTGMTREEWNQQFYESVQDLRLMAFVQEVLIGLLALTYGPAHPLTDNQWRAHVAEYRSVSRETLDAWPWVAGTLPQNLPAMYARARKGASDRTGLPLATFPETCPWPVAQILDADFWPEPNRN
jgi:hypothetical protein